MAHREELCDPTICGRGAGAQLADDFHLPPRRFRLGSRARRRFFYSVHQSLPRKTLKGYFIGLIPCISINSA